MACNICRGRLRRDVFQTGRVAICRPCINLLNETTITPRQADALLMDAHRVAIGEWAYRRGQFSTADNTRRLACLLLNDPAFLERMQGKWFSEWRKSLLFGQRHASGQTLVAVKVLRAHRRKLLRANPRLNKEYPGNWKVLGAKMRAADSEKCRLCGRTWETGTIDLHIHHIIHRSNGGSHNAANLVTLCHIHHNDEHPELTFLPLARSPDTLQPLPVEDPTDSPEPPRQPVAVELAWSLACAQWATQHQLFLAEANRVAEMQAAINEIDIDTDYTLPAAELLARAQELAFKRTEWPPAPKSSFDNALQQFRVEHSPQRVLFSRSPWMPPTINRAAYPVPEAWKEHEHAPSPLRKPQWAFWLKA